jgi:hypothetical protein
MSSPSSISTSEITVGKFDFARKKALFQKDEKNKIAHDSFKIDKKTVTLKFKAVTASEKILVSKYGLSLPITVEDSADLEGLQRFSEFIPNYLQSMGETTWETTEFVKEDDKIFLKLKFDTNKQAQFKSNVPITLKKPHDASIHNDQAVDVTVTMKFYFNFETETCGATINVTQLFFEIDEDDIEQPVAKRVKN